MAILAQSSADFALTYIFRALIALGSSSGHLCDSVIFLLYKINQHYRLTNIHQKATQEQVLDKKFPDI